MKEVLDSCPARGVISTVGGYGLGTIFGLFLSSADFNNSEEFLKQSTKEQVKQTFKDMGKRAHATGKQFAFLGAVYATSECIIESYRAKHDIYNSISAGCFTGAVLAGRAGPQAMAVGCASFAAFSAAIDTYMANSDIFS
ncbi:mitochondrial inner membrane translocase subunit Tim17/Tim22/Tim23/peroxisomal protein PMP24 [Gorgonomyces haynaldii]|nr:mitochondrial inner membrane translocase subunit Tim17/Tim22/Tim23/peroxisomal protein PMP24 [Gorgonomyces haynaldii]